MESIEVAVSYLVRYDVLLQNAGKVYYKIRELFYYKMRQFHKIRRFHCKM